jgi:hypothetical protein
MKRVLIFTAGVLCSIANVQAQQKFNVQNGTKTEFYDDLETTMQKAVSGDTIYLPGGVVEYPSNELIIDKKLAIIGAGHDADSIGGLRKTLLRYTSSSPLTVNYSEGSDGSFITGCDLYEIGFGHYNDLGVCLQNIENVTVSRNKITYIYLGHRTANNQVNNVFIRENVIGAIYGYNATNCTINNNLVENIGNYSGSYGFLKYSSLYNNVITSAIYNCLEFCTLKNNFIAVGSSIDFSNCENCVFNNNAFRVDVKFPVNSILADNLFNQEATKTFINFTNIYSDLSCPSNFKIQENSPCKTAGTDGTEIGIFGGSTPYSSIPFNPHIEKAGISPHTDKDGNLKVDIKVSARNR